MRFARNNLCSGRYIFKKQQQQNQQTGFEPGTFGSTRLHLTTTPLKMISCWSRKVFNLIPFPWNFCRKTHCKVYGAVLTGLLTVKKQCKRISWQWKNIPYKADTTPPRSRTQNICFLISIFPAILNLMIKITSIFHSYRFSKNSIA